MARIGRNERCPCGSGAKFKRCCGTREAQATFERQACALEKLLTLPLLFPRLRPRGEAFAAWAGRAALEQLDEPPLEEGLALLEAPERKRIEREHGGEHPSVWRSLVDEVGDEELAREAVVRGAVAAGVWERRPLGSQSLALVEEWHGADAAETLSLVLAPSDLWSAFESAATDEALAELDEDRHDAAYDLVWNATIADTARRLGGTWHESRLTELVARVRSALPIQDRPETSALLARACEAFGRDCRVRERLAMLLLAESVCGLELPVMSTLAA